MSIDMNTYGREIRKAIDEVVADSGNDWCIFGYEGKSYTLKVLTEGDGGLEEMVDEFHGSKIMYGYCKVKEPNTGLPKYVFINWQGEGAPERMKFACGSHSSEVQRVCRIAHVTINARDDSDVIPSEIIGRVVSASGSQHSVLKSSNIEAPVEPVKPPKPASKGSVYKKVNATSEILNRERDAYWQKIEAEERKAKQEEEKRRREEKERREREIRERDKREAAERERRTSERSQQIAQQRVHERQSQMQVTRQQSQQEVMDDVAEYENERRIRSASLKNERQAELANLIAQRNASGLEPSQKVGTNYKKINPRQELAMSTRDQYWTNLEAEEAKMKEEEKWRRKEEVASLEQSRKEREEEETRRRESQERARSTAIAQQRQAERERAELDKRTKEAQERAIHQEAIADEKERQSRSERLRKERQEEAARLIGQRGSGGGGVSNARNFFQQQNSQSESSPSQQRPMPGRLPRMGVPASNPVSVPEPEPEPVVQTVTPPAPQPAYQPAYQPVSQPQRRESSGLSEEEEAPMYSYDPPFHEPEPEQPVQPSNDDRGFCCQALYDYEATEDDEISFNPGDIIIRIEQIDEGWWMGEDTQGHRGLFPANYVKPL